MVVPRPTLMGEMHVQEAVLRDSKQEWVEDTFKAVAPRLWRALLLYSGSADVAGDAVSEAFVQAMSSRQEIREPKAWIWTTAFKLAAGEMARRTDDIQPPDLPVQEGVDPDSVVDLIRALARSRTCSGER